MHAAVYMFNMQSIPSHNAGIGDEPVDHVNFLLEIRAWWSLNHDAPTVRFTLEINYGPHLAGNICHGNPGRGGEVISQ